MSDRNGYDQNGDGVFNRGFDVLPFRASAAMLLVVWLTLHMMQQYYGTGKLGGFGFVTVLYR